MLERAMVNKKTKSYEAHIAVGGYRTSLVPLVK
jgi:hypothetical protein